MSDISRGPGWWIASDGKWYPPHLHPSVRIPDPTEADRGSLTVFSDPSTTDAGPSADASPGRRSKMPLAVALSLAVVVLLVAGSVVVFGGSKSASAQVVDAVNSTLNNGTAHVTVTVSGTADATNLSGAGSGSIDFTNHAMQLHLTMSVLGEQVPLDAVYQGGVVYESVPGLSTVLPGKSWLSIDLSALQQAAAKNPSADGLFSDPAVMLQMLAQQGNQVVALGPSTVDGVAVDGYRVTVTPSAIAQQLKGANLPSWMRQAVSGLKVHTMTLNVFVNHAGMLRSFETQLSESTSAGSVSFDDSLDFSDYGAPVTVTAPPADQVESYQQFLQAAASQGAPTP